MFEVAGVHRLLELVFERHDQHGLFEADRLAHQREATGCNHRAGGGEVLDEAVFREGSMRDVAVDLVLFDPSTQAVDAALETAGPQGIHQRLVVGSRLVHEQVLAARRRRLDDLAAQDRGDEGRALLEGQRAKEGGDHVVVRERQLGANEGLGDAKVRVLAFEDGLGMAGAIDDLDVVDAEHRQAVRPRVEVGPGLEVADDDLGLEALDEVEVGLDVGGHGVAALEDVGPKGLAPADPILLRDEMEPVDLVHEVEGPGQKGVGTSRGHDLDVMALGEQMLEHDLGADGVAHSLADDAVEDLHRRAGYPATHLSRRTIAGLGGLTNEPPIRSAVSR